MKSFLVALVALLALAASLPAAEKKPNIVFILADDLGYADVSFDGRKEWSTPNLHRLSQEGTVFRRWYTATPVCMPSRAALMTGRYGIHNGVIGNSSLDLPSEETTIAEALKARGYATGIFGKWHRGGPRPGHTGFTHPMDQGFDEFFGFVNAVAAWQKFPKELWNGREQKPSQGYADTLFADHAIDFINRHRNEPFFCYVPFTCPHGLIQGPPDEIDAFKGKFKETDPAKPLNATYAAMITRMDKDIGRILKKLDDLDLAHDTVVVFTSDHGASYEKMTQGTTTYFDSNRPFRGQKRTLWEGGLRVPAVVRWPGRIPAKVDTHEIIHMCDVFPTLLAVAGGEPDPAWKIDGVNMLDVWRGKGKAPADRMLFWNWEEGGDTQFAAMQGDLKIVVSGGNRPELFDVEADPAERREANALHPDEVKKLEDGLNTWRATASPAAKQRQKPATSQSAQD